MAANWLKKTGDPLQAVESLQNSTQSAPPTAPEGNSTALSTLEQIPLEYPVPQHHLELTVHSTLPYICGLLSGMLIVLETYYTIVGGEPVCLLETVAVF